MLMRRVVVRQNDWCIISGLVKSLYPAACALVISSEPGAINSVHLYLILGLHYASIACMSQIVPSFNEMIDSLSYMWCKRWGLLSPCVTHISSKNWWYFLGQPFKIFLTISIPNIQWNLKWHPWLKFRLCVFKKFRLPFHESSFLCSRKRRCIPFTDTCGIKASSRLEKRRANTWGKQEEKTPLLSLITQRRTRKSRSGGQGSSFHALRSTAL